MAKNSTLIIGGGGREHALAVAMLKSKRAGKLYCIPGNAGIAALAECRPEIKATDFEAIVTFIKKRKDIKLVVIGPDDPLALGLTDLIEKETAARVFGPRKGAAEIESSKIFAKNLMKKYNIPTAGYTVCDTENEARVAIRRAKFPCVIKADGLALGKGVVICPDLKAAEVALDDFFVKQIYGKAGLHIVIEEFLQGFEVSVLAFCDGRTIVPMVSSQDHKKAYTGNLGPNTGGMGTYAPCALYTPELAEKAYKTIMVPTVEAMRKEGRVFKGVIFFGFMIDGDNINVLEYNARFGDPETQVVLPLLKTDIMDIIDAVIDGNLDKINIEWHDKAAVCVVAASGGYPLEYKKGLPIKFNKITNPAVTVYHAGTALQGKTVVTAGGRVLGVSAVAGTLEDARMLVYENIKQINFEGMYYREDIAVAKQ